MLSRHVLMNKDFVQRLVFCVALSIFASNSSALAQASYKFNFGGSKTEPEWIHVSPSNVYSSSAGFGFEPGAQPVAGTDSNSSTASFYFSAREPEGNYKVTATFAGHSSGGEMVLDSRESTVTVKAELRRLMVENVYAPPWQPITCNFIVNLRTPEIPRGGHVHLKPRETTSEQWDWDDKLTLEFNGRNPSLQSLQIEPVSVPTVYLLGDSTVCDQPAEPWNSWGQMLPRFFKPQVAVANHAESGETIANSLRAQRFEKVFSLMKPGDYLFVQFGHNDMKEKATNALEVYKSNLKKVVERTRSLSGTPVLVTSMERKAGIDGPTLKGYPDAVREVAKQESCALIDLNAMSLVFYRALGTNLDKAFQDGTHHNNYGSYELAKCVVDGIKQAKLPLANFIVDGFEFDPSHPDDVDKFQMAVSPINSNTKPLGN